MAWTECSRVRGAPLSEIIKRNKFSREELEPNIDCLVSNGSCASRASANRVLGNAVEKILRSEIPLIDVASHCLAVVSRAAPRQSC